VPLRKDAKIYLPHNAWSQFPPSGEIADVSGIRIVPEYEVQVDLAKAAVGNQREVAVAILRRRKKGLTSGALPP
jgi:hypothetical protein